MTSFTGDMGCLFGAIIADLVGKKIRSEGGKYANCIERLRTCAKLSADGVCLFGYETFSCHRYTFFVI